MDAKSNTPLAEDRLDGARAIAEFYYGPPVTPETLRKTYYGIERGYIKAGKRGNSLTASKKVLIEQHRRQTGGAESGA
jgi:hypothetical protein